MSGEIVFELNIFAKAIMLGVICGLFYDCIRIGRRIVKKKYIATSIEDLLLNI